MSYCAVWSRRIFALLLVLSFGIPGGCVTDKSGDFDAGPLAAWDRDVHGDRRVRILGPLIETQSSTNGMKFRAVRPFYSRAYDPEMQRSIADVVWPIGMWKRRFGELDWRFFPAWGHNYDTTDPQSRKRWTLFPFFYGGRGINRKPYFAIFPFGGVLRNFVGRDIITFVLFPLYSRSVQDDLVSHSVFWPIFSTTRSENVFRWRIFPFYGVSIRKNEWIKRFIMWPFWTSVKYNYPNQKGGGFILWPLFGHIRVGDSYSWGFLPPFFKYQKGKDGYRALFCPWPFIRYKRGKVNQLYIWPLWGKRSSYGDRKWFVLWPIVRNRHVQRLTYRVHRFRIFPVVAYESRIAETRGKDGGYIDGDVFGRYFKLWPFFSYERRHDVVRFRSLTLWPMRNPAAVDRNWSPLWNVFRYERDGEERETELLWGMYRHRRGVQGRHLSIFPLLQVESVPQHDKIPARRGWSLLYGLFGYHREELHKELKLLYFIKFRWGGGVSEASAAGNATPKTGSEL